MTEVEKRILENQQIIMSCLEVLVDKEMREEIAQSPQRLEDMRRNHTAIADLDEKSTLLNNSCKETAALLKTETEVEERLAVVRAANQEKQPAMSDKEALSWLNQIGDLRQLVHYSGKGAVALAIAKSALKERIAQEAGGNRHGPF